MRIKICGLTDPDQAAAIARLGVHGIGCILVPGTPRYVPPERLRAIVRALPPFTQAVGVFVDAGLEAIVDCVRESGLGAVQLHGQESPQFCRDLGACLPGVARIKALRVRTADDLARAADYAGVVGALLLDAWNPQTAGGTGQRFDWGLLVDFRPPLPWILAGGLRPENLRAALTLRPDGIDLSSGVEDHPGHKNPDKVAEVVRIAFENLYDGRQAPT